MLTRFSIRRHHRPASAQQTRPHPSPRNNGRRVPAPIVVDQLEQRCLFSAVVTLPPTASPIHPTPALSAHAHIPAGTNSPIIPQGELSATVNSVSVSWGTSGTASLTTAADGLRLLPAGRNTDLPWYGINQIHFTLNSPETLSPSDVSVTGISVANYGPVTISGSGSNYTITLAQPITTADRVTITIGSDLIATYTRRLDVLPGDINDDGVVNTQDLLLVRSAASGPYNIFDDINGDGVIDADDATLLRRFLGQELPSLI
jgi:hypothetical protein